MKDWTLEELEEELGVERVTIMRQCKRLGLGTLRKIRPRVRAIWTYTEDEVERLMEHRSKRDG